jgi:multidrug efflux system membrane fusion protein
MGAAYAVTVEALPGSEFRGRVTAIKPAADPKSRVFEVEVTVPNPGGKLQVGMIAALEVPGGRVPSAGAAVPLGAVVRAPGAADQFAVFVVDESGGTPVVRSQPVTLGPPLGGNRVAITSGVTAGDRVVVEGAGMLRDGQPVRIAS